MLNNIIYTIIGLASGVISGMGMGGGTLLIPALTLLMGVPQRAAQGVNMLAFLPGAAVALYVHHKAGRLMVKKSIPMIIFGVAGAVAGALLAGKLGDERLKRVFGVFLVVMSAAQFFYKGKDESK